MSQRLALVGGLFGVLLLALLLIPPADERRVPLTVYSAEPGGAKALRLWLEALGYPVSTVEGDRYAIGRDVRTMLVLAPTQEISTAALGELERWTRRGGRLVVGVNGVYTRELLRRFGVSTRPTESIARAVPAESGVLDPAITTIEVDAGSELVLGERASGAIPLLVGQQPETSSYRPILAARAPADRGELIVLTVPDVLSNAGLHDEAKARLALSLIGPRERGQVAFDELHHGFGSLERRHLYSLLLEQSWGRTAILAGVLVLIFLLLRGRRLGRPVPVFVDRGRSLGELVTSQASLYRAGGKRAFVAEHLARQLRHDLTRTLGLPADTTDDKVIDRATAMGLDSTRALQLVHQTRNARSDRELLRLTRDGAAARTALRSPHPERAR